MLLSSGAAVMSCSFCPAGLSQVSWTSAALTWLADSDLSLPPEQFCWASLRMGVKPCNWTRGCCWQVGSQWVQLSWSGIWREKKAVAWGKELWQKQKILMILKLGEEAHAAFYVWRFELLIKPQEGSEPAGVLRWTLLGFLKMVVVIQNHGIFQIGRDPQGLSNLTPSGFFETLALCGKAGVEL